MNKQPLQPLELLLDGNRGIYIPQEFAKQCNPANTYWCYSLEDEAILQEGPDHEMYWETWEDVLNNARYDDGNGNVYTLEQGDDLWAIREGYYRAETGAARSQAYEYIELPAHWANYIANADPSGLNVEDIRMCDKDTKELQNLSVTDEPTFFGRYRGKGCDLVTCAYKATVE